MVCFLFLYDRLIAKNHLRFYWEKIFWIHYLHISLETHVHSQFWKIFLSKFSSDIYFSRFINYWASIFTLYLTWGAFSLVCVLSVFFFFLSFISFLFFSRYFLWQTLTIHSVAGKGEGTITFLVFHLLPLANIHLVHWDFYHFF